MTNSSLVEDLGADWQSNWQILWCVSGGQWFLTMTDSSLVEDLGADCQSNWLILFCVSGEPRFLAMTDSSLIEDLGCWLTTDRFCGLFRGYYGSWQWLTPPWLRTWGVDWLLTDSCFVIGFQAIWLTPPWLRTWVLTDSLTDWFCCVF